MPKVDERELAWAAGFFDGEGCIYSGITRYSKEGKLHYSPQVTISIDQIHPAVLVRFQRIVGRGKVYGPYKPPSSGKNDSPMWSYRLGKYDDCLEVMMKIRPFLGEIKRRQSYRAFKRADLIRQVRDGVIHE